MTTIVATVTFDAVHLASGLTFMLEEKFLLQVYLTSVAVLALTVVKQCFRYTVVTGRGLETEIYIFFDCPSCN